MVKKLFHKAQAISLLVAGVLFWIPSESSTLKIIASVIISLNILAEWF